MSDRFSEGRHGADLAAPAACIAPDGDAGQLLVKHREGDTQAFTALVNLFRSLIYSYLVRCGVNSSDRDDLFQNVFLNVHRNAAKYDSSFQLKPWIFTITANAVRDYFRSQKVRQIIPIENLEQQNLSHDGHETSVALETVAWLEKAIALLPLQQREVFVMCSLKSFDQATVSQSLNIPVNTVKTQLSRARATLARALVARNASIKRETGA